MAYATITGQLKDSDGTAWSNATWTAVPVSPSSKPVFPDGSPVPTTGGLLDATGHFSGQIPQTIDIRPPGTTLTVTITSMTSAPPLTLTKVQIVSPTTVDLGALLSPRIVAPRIKAAPIVYAYAPIEVTNPVHGNGYINTVENQSYIFMQNSWVKIGVGGLPEDVVRLDPTINQGRLTLVTNPPSTTSLLIDTLDTPYKNVRFASMTATTDHQGGFQFDGWNSDFTKTEQYLLMHDSLNTGRIDAVFSVPLKGTKGFIVQGASPQDANSCVISSTPSDAIYIDAVGATTTARPTMHFRQYASGGALIVESLGIDENANATFFGSINTPRDIHAGGNFSINGFQQGLRVQGLNTVAGNHPNEYTVSIANPGQAYVDISGPDTSTLGIMHFRVMNSNGSSYNEILSITPTGVAVSGTLSATGAKTFNIPHPLGGERRLVHACLEGPENGVYYRGAALLVDGRAIVELPDYFEALTQADGRTVQLTQVDDGGELGLFAASPVVDGKFSIRSNVSAASVYWEVKAERRDLPRLDVEPATKGERSESES